MLSPLCLALLLLKQRFVLFVAAKKFHFQAGNWALRHGPSQLPSPMPGSPEVNWKILQFHTAIIIENIFRAKFCGNCSPAERHKPQPNWSQWSPARAMAKTKTLKPKAGCRLAMPLYPGQWNLQFCQPVGDDSFLSNWHLHRHIEIKLRSILIGFQARCRTSFISYVWIKKRKKMFCCYDNISIVV